MVGIDARDRSGRGSVGARRVVTAVAAAAVAVMLVPGAALAATSPQGQNPASGPAAASDTPTTRTGFLGKWGWDTAYTEGNDEVGAPDGDNFVEVDGNDRLLAARRADGSIVAWGGAPGGRLPSPWVREQHDVTAIAAGHDHLLVLHSDGTVTAGGWDYFGQTNVPSDLTDVVQIAAGSLFSMALRSDGTVVAWGNNRSGQTNVPAGLTDIVAIAAGETHALAVRSDGTVVGWGDNDSGQATPPAGLSGVVDVSGGDDFSVAVKSDGSVVAWGYNAHGQTSVPAGLTGVVDIDAGLAHVLALRNDGTVVAWGDNGTAQATVPLGLTDVTDIAAAKAWNVVVTAQQNSPLSDTTPPVITVPTPVITKAATSTKGARVYATPTATDAIFGSVPVECIWGHRDYAEALNKGEWFPPGKDAVTCFAWDGVGNYTHGASYRVHIFYSWSGLQSPVNPEGTTVRDRRKNLPLTFTLTGSSSGIKGVKAKASYALVTNGETGPYTAAKATDRTGNTFVYKNGTYRFNWKTSGLKKGTYSLKVDLGDQKPHTILVKLT